MEGRNLGSINLDFSPLAQDEADFLQDLSAVCRVGGSLWLASDETNHLHRLTTTDGQRYGDRRSTDLLASFDLPDRDGEIDIEGLCVDRAQKTLWVIGSHALRRKRAKFGTKGPEKALKRLGEVLREPNRLFLGCFGVHQEAKGRGVFRLQKKGAATLAIGRKGNQLLRSLAADDHLKRFLTIPAKDNGLDLEGIAAIGDRLLIGCRGPVVGGWAVMLTVVPRVADGRSLRLKKLGGEAFRHRTQFLELDGLGIRDLTLDGDDLLILAGPPTTLDGPFGVYRWRNPEAVRDAVFVDASAGLTKLYDLPPGGGVDYAEGIEIVIWQGRKAVLIVYDRPAPSRLEGNGTYRADVFSIP